VESYRFTWLNLALKLPMTFVRRNTFQRFLLRFKRRSITMARMIRLRRVLIFTDWEHTARRQIVQGVGRFAREESRWNSR
jgi:hypothetical protein